MNPPSDSDALALARHAAASWIQEALKQNFTLARATALASERTWGGKTYSASTLESWYYLLRNQGFDALHRQPRKDKGSRKALSPEACQALLEWRQKYPQLTIQVLVRQLIEKGALQAGTFSLEGRLWEAPVHLRGQLIQIRFDPFGWRRVEIWCQDKYLGPARRCDKQLNSKTYTDRDYERPDKST